MDKSYQAVGLMMVAIGKAINGATSHQDLSKKIVEGVMMALEQLNDRPVPHVSNSGSFKKRLVRNIVNGGRNNAQAGSPDRHDRSRDIVRGVMEVLEQLDDEPAPHVSNNGSFKKRLVRNILRDVQREAKTTSPENGSLSNIEAMVNLARRLSDDDDGDDDDGGDDSKSLFPNLKYAMPKYNNVDSIVKHNGNGDGGEDAVRVTIMNFND